MTTVRRDFHDLISFFRPLTAEMVSLSSKSVMVAAFCVSFWFHLVFCANSDFVLVLRVESGV